MAKWTSSGMARVAEVVRERTGLVFPGARIADVEAAVRRSVARSGVADPDELVRLLEEDPAARDALVAEITVGESYFQRDAAQFEFLREQGIPELLRSRPPSSRIRVWSAGCAAGEEPYTVAMVFDSLAALDRAEIIGTDISRPRLKDAQQGVYSSWALRSTSEEIRQRYFRARGRYFELVRRIQTAVEFRYLNLAEDEYPSFSTGIWGMDIILCRNVLIYFDEATIERVATRLLATLSDDGWLLLGASDPPLADRVRCDVVMTDSGLAYRRWRPGQQPFPDLRRSSRVPALPPLTSVPAAPPLTLFTDPPTDEHDAAPPPIDVTAWPAEPHPFTAAPALPVDSAKAGASPVLEAYGRRDFDAVCRLAEPRAPHLTEPEYIAWLRALANRGHRDRALEVGAQARAAHGESAELCYLDAVLLLEAGRPQEAAAAARKALYLDRGLAVAHVVLANTRQRTNDRAGARRALHNAAALLEQLPPNTVVPAADGETAHRLAELVKVNLRMLSRHDD